MDCSIVLATKHELLEATVWSQNTDGCEANHVEYFRVMSFS